MGFIILLVALIVRTAIVRRRGDAAQPQVSDVPIETVQPHCGGYLPLLVLAPGRVALLALPTGPFESRAATMQARTIARTD
jgi:hypothetical protein